MSNHRRTALITGTSSGIGRALAENFARDGYDVVLTARSEKRLEEHAVELHKRYGVTAVVIAADLESSAGANELFAEIKNRGLTLSALANNAGYGIYGEFIVFRLSPTSYAAYTSNGGWIYFLRDTGPTRILPAKGLTHWEFDSVKPFGLPKGFECEVTSVSQSSRIPHWLPVLALGILCIVPYSSYFQWRFSLRTLLIVTTLVAVVLGIIVWAVG